MIEAFPEDSSPRFLVRDRDGIYGEHFVRRVEGMGIEELPIAPRSPLAELLCGAVDRYFCCP